MRDIIQIVEGDEVPVESEVSHFRLVFQEAKDGRRLAGAIYPTFDVASEHAAGIEFQTLGKHVPVGCFKVWSDSGAWFAAPVSDDGELQAHIGPFASEHEATAKMAARYGV